MGQEQPQLPPTRAIAPDNALRAKTEGWFEYLVKAQPHHTDYGGVVWHGAYLTWLEEARVECLRSIGIDFAELVKVGCDLPVVDLSVRYHRALRLGQSAVIKTRMLEMTGVRIDWDYQMVGLDPQVLLLTAKVTLVAVDRDKGKIMRRLPPTVKDALVQLSR
ncbi:acyl-CoA thioesterase [Spirulina subsalsa FACHB-351]|uniref:Acyl-CoA thioesterase n=1 Tax=Spirulina subsalsa FACHB-351 TaxID=234711 RepID=A0ABT3L2D5_9CYAN|nr:thioesterase family protein [Spirulina subsalsa]MCW6035244.1 acyl-CoA thioesterase [Spirulina subsalsa FACHB-351]